MLFDDLMEYQKKYPKLKPLSLLKEMGYVPINTIHRNGVIYTVCSNSILIISTQDKFLDICTMFDWKSLQASIQETLRGKRYGGRQISSRESDS